MKRRFLFAFVTFLSLSSYADDTEDLVVAIHDSWEEEISRILDHGKPDFSQHVGLETALHAAAREGRLDLLLKFFEKGAKLDVRSAKGYTLLHVVAGIRDPNALPIADWLIENKADVEAKSENDETPLHVAMRNNQLLLACRLILAGADLFATNKITHRTPFEIIAENQPARLPFLLTRLGSSRTMELAANGKADDLAKWPLVKQYINSHVGDLAPLHVAIVRANQDSFEGAVVSGADLELPTKGQDFPIHLVAGYGTCEMMEVLLRKVDVNKRNRTGSTALMTAAQLGRLDMVAILINGGARLDIQDAQGFSALLRAAESGDAIMCAYLVYRGANRFLLNREQHNFLQVAARKNQHNVINKLQPLLPMLFANVVAGCAEFEMLQAFLTGDKNALAQQLDDYGNTPVHLAVGRARFLPDGCAPLQRGETPHELMKELRKVATHTRIWAATHANTDGCSAVHTAAKINRADLLRELHLEPQTFKAAEKHLPSPLMLAALHNATEALTFLLENGANVALRTALSMTALHFAAGQGSKAILLKLLQYGADPCAMDFFGRTPGGILLQRSPELAHEVQNYHKLLCERRPREDLSPTELSIRNTRRRSASVGADDCASLRPRMPASADAIAAFEVAHESPNTLKLTLTRAAARRFAEGVLAAEAASAATVVESKPITAGEKGKAAVLTAWDDERKRLRAERCSSARANGKEVRPSSAIRPSSPAPYIKPFTQDVRPAYRHSSGDIPPRTGTFRHSSGEIPGREPLRRWESLLREEVAAPVPAVQNGGTHRTRPVSSLFGSLRAALRAEKSTISEGVADSEIPGAAAAAAASVATAPSENAETLSAERGDSLTPSQQDRVWVSQAIAALKEEAVRNGSPESWVLAILHPDIMRTLGTAFTLFLHELRRSSGQNP